MIDASDFLSSADSNCEIGKLTPQKRLIRSLKSKFKLNQIRCETIGGIRATYGSSFTPFVENTETNILQVNTCHSPWFNKGMFAGLLISVEDGYLIEQAVVENRKITFHYYCNNDTPDPYYSSFDEESKQKIFPQSSGHAVDAHGKEYNWIQDFDSMLKVIPGFDYDSGFLVNMWLKVLLLYIHENCKHIESDTNIKSIVKYLSSKVTGDIVRTLPVQSEILRNQALNDLFPTRYNHLVQTAFGC